MCGNVQFFPQGPLVRLARKNPETNEIVHTRAYSSLSFSYTFLPEDRGNNVIFAYAVPYGYSDLLKDLNQVKENLLNDENFEQYKPITKEDYLESGYGD